MTFMSPPAAKPIHGMLGVLGKGALGGAALFMGHHYGLVSTTATTLVAITGTANVAAHMYDHSGHMSQTTVGQYLEKLGPITDVALAGALSLIANDALKAIVGFNQPVAVAAVAMGTAIAVKVNPQANARFQATRNFAMAAPRTNPLMVASILSAVAGIAAGRWAYNNAEHVYAGLGMVSSAAQLVANDYKMAAGVVTGLGTMLLTGIGASALLKAVFRPAGIFKQTFRLAVVGTMAVGMLYAHSQFVKNHPAPVKEQAAATASVSKDDYGDMTYRKVVVVSPDGTIGRNDAGNKVKIPEGTIGMSDMAGATGVGMTLANGQHYFVPELSVEPYKPQTEKTKTKAQTPTPAA